MRSLDLSIVEGGKAPRYDTGYETKVEKVVITEQATASNLPIVDFIGVDKDGTQIAFVLTGREVCAIAAAIRGVNQRNHGVEEP